MEEKTEPMRVEIYGYVGPLNLNSYGKRTIRLDIREDQAVPFMAAMILNGKAVKITLEETEE